MSNELLPRQWSNSQAGRWSIARDNQAKEALEDAFQALHGAGVVSGGKVTKTTGYSVELASGTVLYQEGVTYTLPSALAHTVAAAANTYYLFARIRRTAAGVSNPGTEDTIDATLTSNTTGTPPAGYIAGPVAIITADASGVAFVDNAPDGKYLKITSGLWQGAETVAATEGASIPSGYQVLKKRKLTIRGSVKVRGLLCVEGL